ncbi:KOW motif domain protein [Rasamsonia emersonii CBS 393.64]|uniref:KOW motif domain protein n=1 Tax=Rasamsonia emersonii (strain ATCC 16479 / CBS 393.64 / IMI 116815) TaxID=1408163 RepID=A0A0F4YUH2_RASE3|nr:KOW motif domain protein [Rasamsonia emersonii CBS 393.64]KKA21506.1 KOW motif domain protein [Rasamsonia emersonii CBS 393.64]
MQKVIRRTALARNQAQRKAKIAAKKEQREDFKESLRQRFAQERLRLDAEREERLRRREDWLRGPLAPKRDSGAIASYYGALTPQALQPPKVPAHLRRKYINIAPGDRVCIMKGKDKGKIGDVIKVDPETETVTVKDLNMVDVHVPEWLSEAYGSQRAYNAVELPIPIDDVRLVVALEDSVTGNLRDVLVEHVYGGEPFLERPYGSTTPRHTRYIAGENIEIPWPAEDKAPQFRDEPWDTLRMEVETPTWVPSLLHPPFESSILDELRNKYSKYRTRHDPEWVEAKKLEDYKEEYLKSRTLLTPKGELRAKLLKEKEEERKKNLDADGNYIMDKETAEFIERFMQQKAAKENTPAA